MSTSWRDFFFGTFDPAGTISLDKLPGAFWVQALSVRIFGLHTWSIVLPQVIEGVLSILVLFRLVRRLCGPGAGLLASFLLAVSPANVALDRGNISDTLMILLLLLAADSLVSAISSNRWSGLLATGLWVGLAFQAKMLEAWLVLPALWLVLVVGGQGQWTRRLLRIGVLTIVVVIVSLSWMTVVTVTPSQSRPYADGSTDNSVFTQVFVYNGFGRVNQDSPDQLLRQSIGLEIPLPPPPAWNRLLTGPLGLDEGWLMPAAFISLVGGLMATRRRPRHRSGKSQLTSVGNMVARIRTRVQHRHQHQFLLRRCVVPRIGRSHSGRIDHCVASTRLTVDQIISGRRGHRDRRLRRMASTFEWSWRALLA